MSLQVSFQQPAFNDDAPLIGYARASELIAAGGTGSQSSQDGEMAIVTNMGAAVLYYAFGPTPDASATTGNRNTSARFGIGAGATHAVVLNAGDKFAVASS